MSEVTLDLACQYFYGQKFFVLRSGSLLFLRNSRSENADAQPPLLLDAQSVPLLDRAMVKVLSWHTIPVTVKALRTFPEILDFLHETTLRKAAALFNGMPLKKVLVVPHLPVAKTAREETIAALQQAGVEGILLLPEMIEETIRAVEARRSYPVVTCELLRILKHYKLAGRVSSERRGKPPSQLELPL